jgi:hypothetical protein
MYKWNYNQEYRSKTILCGFFIEFNIFLKNIESVKKKLLIQYVNF